MKFHRMRRSLAALLIGILAVTGLPLATSASTAGNNPCLSLSGTISEPSESKIRMNDPVTFQYTIKPDGSLKEVIKRGALDIALVLDISGSMELPMGDGTSNTRLSTLRTSATNFISMIESGSANDRIGIVQFDDKASKLLDLSMNYTALKNTIKNLKTSGGGTNIGGGLKEGKSLLASSGVDKAKYVVLLTDGASTHLNGWNPTESTKYAKQLANELKALEIPVYSIALGAKGGQDVDHELIKEISKVTNGQKYDASNTTELNEVFKSIVGEIKKSGDMQNIEIRQPLPAGFVLAEGNPDNMKIENNELVIKLEDITYPFEAPQYTFDVKLKQVSLPGKYKFEDAKLNYKNACSEGPSVDKSEPLANGKTVEVEGWVDKWGNLYVGDGLGAVTRYKHGDTNVKQFTVPGNGSLVADITFADSSWGDDDAIVKVKYANGTNATWNLYPTAPVLVLKDKDGNIINDLKWHKGDGQLKLSGGKIQLPANTVFTGANNDFQSDYIKGYEYRVKGGSWKLYKPDAGKSSVPIGAVGKDIKVEARAVTAAVSGKAEEMTGGTETEQTVSLDNTGPVIQITHVKEGYTDSKGYSDANPKIKVSITEDLSPITQVVVMADVLNVKDGTIEKVDTKTFTSDATNQEFEIDMGKLFEKNGKKLAPNGNYNFRVVATNAAGIISEKNIAFLINTGPTGELVTADGDNYTTKASSKPVKVVLKDVERVIVPKRTIIVDGVEKDMKAVTLDKMQFKIKVNGSNPDFSKLGSLQFQVTSTGVNVIEVELTDSIGNTTTRQLTVKIDYNQKRH